MSYLLQKLNINPEAKHWKEARKKGLVTVETSYDAVALSKERSRLRKGQDWLAKEYEGLIELGRDGLGSDKQKQFLEQLVRWLDLERDHRLHGATECIWDWPKCNDRVSDAIMVSTCTACANNSKK
jgi:hypothetical protein